MLLSDTDFLVGEGTNNQQQPNSNTRQVTISSAEKHGHSADEIQGDREKHLGTIQVISTCHYRVSPPIFLSATNRITETSVMCPHSLQTTFTQSICGLSTELT